MSLSDDNISLSIFIPTTEIVKEIDEFDIGNISGREVEIVAGMGGGEYLPSLADDNRFYIASRDSEVFTLQGKAIITNQKKENVICVYVAIGQKTSTVAHIAKTLEERKSNQSFEGSTKGKTRSRRTG